MRKTFIINDTIDHILPPISLLIPYRADSVYRQQIFRWNIKRYKMLFPELQICIGDNVGEPFNRSKARNIAAKAASNDLFLFADIDLLVTRDILYDACQKITTYVRMKENYETQYWPSYLIEQHSTMNLLKANLPLTNQQIITRGIAGPFYFCLITREAFYATPGWDENFKGWGLEDGAFFKTIEIYHGNKPSFEGPLYHLWHPHSVDRKPAEWGQNFNPESVRYYDLYLKAKNIKDIEQIRRERR